MSDRIGGKTYTQYRQQIINQYSEKRGTKHLRFSDGKQLYVHNTWKPSRLSKQARLDRLNKRQNAVNELKQSINREFQHLAPNVGDRVFESLKYQGHDFSATGIKLNEQWLIDKAISEVLTDKANAIDLQDVTYQDAMRADNLRTLSSRFEAVARPSSDPNQHWIGNKGTAEDKRLLRGWPNLIREANQFKDAIDADYYPGKGEEIERHLRFQEGVDIYKGFGFEEIAKAKRKLASDAPNIQPVHLNVFRQRKEAQLKNRGLKPILSQTHQTIAQESNRGIVLFPHQQAAKAYLAEYDKIEQALSEYRRSGMQDFQKGAQLAQRLRTNLAKGAEALQHARLIGRDNDDPLVKNLQEHLRASHELLLAHDPPQNQSLNRPPVLSLQALQASDQHQELAQAASAVDYFNQPIAYFDNNVDFSVLHAPYQGYKAQFRQVSKNYQDAMAEVQQQSQAFAAEPSDENLAKLHAVVDKAGRASDRFLIMLSNANKRQRQGAGALYHLQNNVTEQRKALQRLSWHAGNINDIRNHLATGLLQNQNFPIAQQHQRTGDAQAAYQRSTSIELAKFVHNQPNPPLANQPGQQQFQPLPPVPDVNPNNWASTQGMPDTQGVYGEIYDDDEDDDLVDAGNQTPDRGEDDDLVDAINHTKEGMDQIEKENEAIANAINSTIDMDQIEKENEAIANVINHTIDGMDQIDNDDDAGDEGDNMETIVAADFHDDINEINQIYKENQQDNPVEMVTLGNDMENDDLYGLNEQDQHDGNMTPGNDKENDDLYGLNEQDKRDAEIDTPRDNDIDDDDLLDNGNFETIQ